MSPLKNTNWKEGTTKHGNRRFYRLYYGKWLNAVLYPHNKIYITYAGEKINHHLLWDEENKDQILNGVVMLVADIPKAWEDMKQHEKLAEIGKNENIKYNKQFGDGFEIEH
jgi:hypothetical protein